MRALSISPSGIVHLANIYGNRGTTRCGREIDQEKWTRIHMDIYSQGPSAIRKKIELPVCERCFK